MGIFKRFSLFLVGVLLSVNALSDTEINEVKCLADNIYFEGRNQPWVGQVAVAQVTMNRVRSINFPSTVCEVVKQAKYYPSGSIDLHSCQFSWFCDGKSDEPKNQEQYSKSFKTAMYVYSGSLPDVTEGSLWYHAKYIKVPFWASSLKIKVKINDHIFYSTR